LEFFSPESIPKIFINAARNGAAFLLWVPGTGHVPASVGSDVSPVLMP
jgi:hypothetical protein